MLIVTKRKYKKQHVIGGAGIFDTAVGFFKNLFTSNATKKIATALVSSAAKHAGKHLASKILEPPPVITQSSRDNLTRMINDVAPPVAKASNINNLMMHGNGAVAIQDLVKKINGTSGWAHAASGKGMKIVK